MSEIPADTRAALEGLRALGGDDLLKQMVGVFIDYSGEKVAALQTACAAGDLATAASAAHALKGSSRQMGFNAMADACSSCEASAKGGDLPSTQTHAAAVHATYTTAVDWLRQLNP